MHNNVIALPFDGEAVCLDCNGTGEERQCNERQVRSRFNYQESKRRPSATAEQVAAKWNRLADLRHRILGIRTTTSKDQDAIAV